MKKARSLKSLVAGSAVISCSALPQSVAKPLSKAEVSPARTRPQGPRPAAKRGKCRGYSAYSYSYVP